MGTVNVKHYCLGGGEEFYPTPKELARKMLEQIDFSTVFSVLEPSAGKGDLAAEILRQMNISKSRHCTSDEWRIDLVEVDPALRDILRHRFTKEGNRLYAPDLFRELDEIEENRTSYFAKESGSDHYFKLKEQIRWMENEENVRIVHDDFLTYSTMESYDAIIMNPPFKNADLHLLHAVGLLQHYGGQIVCIMNAETIRNPYTVTRQQLANILEQYHADVEFLSDTFNCASAERKTDVEIAMIRLRIPGEKPQSRIFERLEKAEEEAQRQDPKRKELISSDPIAEAVAMYQLEVNASRELIDEYLAYKNRVEGFLREKSESSLVLQVVNSSGTYRDLNRNTYMKAVRRKYWKALLGNPKFTGLLTQNLQRKYMAMVNDLAVCEFSEFNIRQMQREMMSEMVGGVKETIMDLFETLTSKYCYDRSVQNGNIHYYNGWRTNSAYKIGMKCIIPRYGLFSQWSGNLQEYETLTFLSDMEKALNYLGGESMDEVGIKGALRRATVKGSYRNIRLKYFTVSLYKKGTVHIVFRDQALIDRFNIFAGQQKGWLPPSYGKKAYKDMTPEEAAVIDSFQGEKAYNAVMKNPSKYLMSDTILLRLGAG